MVERKGGTEGKNKQTRKVREAQEGSFFFSFFFFLWVGKK
jgi:hypothetical protein